MKLAFSPYLAPFLATQGATSQNRETTANLLPPSVAAGLFAKFALTDDSQNYKNLNSVAEKIAQARSFADEQYNRKQYEKAQKEREKALLKKLRQMNPTYPTGTGTGGSGGGNTRVPVSPPPTGTTGGGDGLLPRITPPQVVPRRCTEIETLLGQCPGNEPKKDCTPMQLLKGDC